MKTKNTATTTLLKKLASVMTVEDKEAIRQKVYAEMAKFQIGLSEMIDKGEVSSTAAKAINDEAFRQNPLWGEVLYKGVLK